MKTITLIFLLTFLISAQNITPDERGFLVKVGDPVPDFEMIYIDGSSDKYQITWVLPYCSSSLLRGVQYVVRKRHI